MKIRPVGAELFHADGQTDTTKLIFAFRNFANAPKKACAKECLSFHSVIRQLEEVTENATRWQYNTAHGLCMLDT
jgi:hypothetical protein